MSRLKQFATKVSIVVILIVLAWIIVTAGWGFLWTVVYCDGECQMQRRVRDATLHPRTPAPAYTTDNIGAMGGPGATYVPAELQWTATPNP